MDATSSSFAVSSLCAATATCSAAAVGLTWATTGASDRSASPPANDLEHRPTTSVRRSTSKRSFLARPRSAVVSSSRDNPWALTPGPPASNRASHQSGTPVESLQEAEEAEDIATESLAAFPQRRASTWFRQRLTLTPSSGQNSQATDYPSTPSTYTNASNTPLFSTPALPVSSRNRLVKRSTSQRFIDSSNIDSTAFRPTFRRPATSHQRSAESRTRNLRHERSHSSAAPSIRADRVSTDSNNKYSSWRWEPFFKKRVVRVKAQPEPLLKSPGDLFLGKKDELTCVRAPSGQLPTLVMAASITAQISVESDFASPVPLKSGRFGAYQHINEPMSAPVGRKLSQFREDFPEKMSTNDDAERRVSSSFSLGNLIPSPSPAPFKIVRRSSRKYEASIPIAGVRNGPDSRVLPRSQFPDGPARTVSDADARSVGMRDDSNRLPHARSVSDVGAAYRDSQLPDDVAGKGQISTSKTRDPTSRGHRHSFSGGTEQSGNGIALSSSSNSNFRLSRGSRIASDHGSTVHGSDTDNSRVFSVNGDDYDAFSETNYDSFRTGGTNSSQSAQRPTRIEGMFEEQGRDGFHGDGLSVLEEKLSDSSPSSSPRHPAQSGGSHTNNRDLSRRSEPELDTSAEPYAHSRLATSPLSPPSPTAAVMDRFQSPGFSLQDMQVDFDDALWDVPEEDGDMPASTLYLGDISPPVFSSHATRNAAVTPEPQKKVNLWDWSEKQQDDDRPKTVHGKNPVDRSNRAGNRRPNVHIRSQSVPNVGDNTKARFNDASKLDAWTLGGKGASEDWDDDFDVDGFEEEPEDITTGLIQRNKDLRSSGFVVPDTILEKQSSVHYQFNHVKELSQQVETLRRLRRTADDLGIRDGRATSMWEEADAIIDLATLEEDEELAPPRPASPTSDSFDFDFDERQSTPASTRQSISAFREDASSRNSPAQLLRGISDSNGPPSPAVRPRQGSTVQAKHLLEHLHANRSEENSPKVAIAVQATPATPSRQERPRKQPFDTQSLKDLVFRAGVLTRALQNEVRAAEEERNALPGTPRSHKRSGSGLGLTPGDANRDQMFTQLFQHPGPISTPPSQRRSPMIRREREGTPQTPGREASAADFLFDSPSHGQRRRLDSFDAAYSNGDPTKIS